MGDLRDSAAAARHWREKPDLVAVAHRTFEAGMFQVHGREQPRGQGAPAARAQTSATVRISPASITASPLPRRSRMLAKNLTVMLM